MSHSVHPKAYRLRRVSDWDSRWFEHKRPSIYLEEDFKIRKFLNNKLKEAGVEKIEIERSANKTIVFISTSRPGLIIGRGGEQVDKIKKELESKILKNDDKGQQLKIEIKSIKNLWLSAPLVSQWIAQQIEKRMPFRRVIKRAALTVEGYKEIKGVRVQVSGRLNGVSISRNEWIQKGSLPKNTIRADIDYGFTKACCSYGVIGVKVWLYKGEKFEDKD
ncbi:30S ribosomal protein S3 [Patescibacteria group bacterium]|nr:30S ribosomal protein S3 [Patescibacteria group bacterium]MBU4023520.1 30S ribosomal protein S3 [Patescibacteria group bacterium]MBU4078020.1 30S ribosomal protein S3 [Patescibacteria group bacterium]